MTIDQAKLEQAIQEQHAADPFSGVISVYEKGQLIYGQGFGLANRSDEIPNSPSTRFGIASGGKTFTALAVCQLVERGLLDFETPLSDCLPRVFPTFHPGVTIHHLLSHSSGIPDYFDEEESDDYEALWLSRPMYALLDPQDFLPFFQNLPMKFDPGKKWYYNNGAYLVLGMVVEEISEMAYREYVRANIFEPCGMEESNFFRLDQLPARTAQGYIAGPDGDFRTNQYSIPVIGQPDGGVFTTAPDLHKFWECFYTDGRLVSQATRQRMLYPYFQTGPDATADWYGYGFWLKNSPAGVTSAYLLGEDPGAACLSAWYPGKEVEFSMLANIVPSAWKMVKRINPILRDENG